MRVYCDTDALFHNIEKHADQPEVQAELDALQFLLDDHAAGRIALSRSHVNLREVERTRDSDQLRRLLADCDSVPSHLKLCLYHSIVLGLTLLRYCRSLMNYSKVFTVPSMAGSQLEGTANVSC